MSTTLFDKPDQAPDPRSLADRAVIAFDRLVAAQQRNDFIEVRKATRELRACGFSVVPVAPAKVGGR